MSRIRDRVISGVKFMALDKVSVQLLSLVSLFLIVNNISLHGFGLFNLLFTFVSVATTYAIFGMDRLVVADMVTYRARGELGRAKKLFLECLKISAGMLLLLFSVAWFLRFWFSQFYDADLNKFFLILVVMISAQMGMVLLNMLFESRERFRRIFLLNLTESVLRLLILLAYFFWFQFSLISVLYAYAAAKIVAVLILGILSLRDLLWQGVPAVKESVLLPTLKQHGKWEMGLSLFETLFSNAVPWVINTLISTEGVALYAFATKLNSVFIRVLPVRSAIFPILIHSIEKSRELASLIITKAKKYLFLIYLVLYVFMFFASGPLISIFAPEYHGAEILIKLAMLRLFVDVLSLGQSGIIYAVKGQRLSFVIALISLPAMLTAQTLGATHFNVAGVIMGTVLVALVVTLLREYLFSRLFGFRVTNFRALITFDQYDKMLIDGLKNRFRTKIL